MKNNGRPVTELRTGHAWLERLSRAALAADGHVEGICARETLCAPRQRARQVAMERHRATCFPVQVSSRAGLRLAAATGSEVLVEAVENFVTNFRMVQSVDERVHTSGRLGEKRRQHGAQRSDVRAVIGNAQQSDDRVRRPGDHPRAHQAHHDFGDCQFQIGLIHSCMRRCQSVSVPVN